MRASLTLLCTLLLASSLYAGNEPHGKDTRIAWDYSSMQQIADKGGYVRLLRLRDNSIIVIYETRTGSIEYKRSYDNGLSWPESVGVFSRFEYSNQAGASVRVNVANPEIIQLANGDLVIGCNYRPQKPEVAPFSIAIRRSEDNGKTWLAPQVLYNAAPRFTDGCWEPSFLQLPNNELQVYFANENPYQKSDEQEISVMSSTDNGRNWSAARAVSFRKGRRDGMPVPILAGDEIIVAIEDNRIGQFKPYTVRTTLKDNWSKPVLANSPDRKYALVENMPDSVYLGAPYLIKLPFGGTLIAYQTNEHRSSNWELSTMEVAAGSDRATDFTRRTRPFNVPLNKESKWNSLAVWDSTTVVALGSANFASENIAPWMIKGYVLSDLKLGQKEISSYPLFVGAKGPANLKAGLRHDTDNLYVKCMVNDSGLHKTDNPKGSADGVYLFLSDGKHTYKIWSSREGRVKVWNMANSGPDKETSTGISASARPGEGRYELAFVIPKKELTGNNLRFAVALSARDSSNAPYVEYLANMEENEASTWLKIELTK